MSSITFHRIANLFIWAGLVMMVVGCALMYPFVRDTIEAQSDPSVTLSFVITLPPAPSRPAVAATPPAPAPTQPVIAAGSSTPDPTASPSPVPTQLVAASVTSTSAPAPAQPVIAAASSTPGPTASPSPVPAFATPTVTSSPVPAPVVLPDDSASNPPVIATLATAQPTPIATGIPPDRMVIPAIDLDAPVVIVSWHIEQVGGVATSVWDVPNQRAAGWLKTSAPAGQPGNTVLDGHHNIRGEVFRRLIDLKPNDTIDLWAGGSVYHYVVTEKHILKERDQPIEVRLANAQWIQPTTDERLTLVTCWPYTNNTHRLVIVARPLPPSLSDRQKGNNE